MAIPKIKLYRLDKSYDPSNDTDIQSVNDDEIYPFSEKSVDLTKFEQLVGVTYRDLMAGKSKSGFEEEILMYNNGTEISPNYDRFKSALVNCDGWRRDDIKVYISTDEGVTYNPKIIPEKYYRLNFTTSPIFDNENNPTWKRQATYVQVEFGKWIYSGVGEVLEFIPEPEKKPVNKIKLSYSLFSDDLKDPLASDESLSLQYGHIYDGTLYGRQAAAVAGTSTAIKDENGIPLKPEGNLGYKIRTYPCRQKVAYTGDDKIGNVPDGKSWVKDLQIDLSGKITITDCDSWIIAQTDNRRPRLFQQITVISGGTSYTSYIELEQGVQYTSTLLTDASGKFNIVFQLSSEYYNFSYGKYLFPSEIFVRYNEENDIMDDLFKPNYLELIRDSSSGTWAKKSGTDTGALTSNQSTYTSISKQIFKTALTPDVQPGPEDIRMSWSGDTFTIELPPGAYNENNNTIQVWEDGVLIYSKGSIPSAAITYTPKYKNPSLSSNKFSMTLVNPGATKPSSLLLSYFEKKTFSNEKVQGASTSQYSNPWAVGWRICAYEKTKTAPLFVSSFRNWVGDHLNNSPDIFEGYAKYDGSVTNATGINYINSGFSVLYRNGAVSFSNSVTQVDFDDVKNWPPSGLTINYQNISTEDLRLYTNLINAKFAYYDALQDVNNGLLRKISVGANFFAYGLLEDPTYITDNSYNYSEDNDAKSKTSLKEKRWIIRNDSKMPTLFYKNNKYLPAPVNCIESEASLWEPNQVQDGKFLQINISEYRSIFVENAISSPPVKGDESPGETITKYGNISWSSSYSSSTAIVEKPSSGSIIFPVGCTFIWNQSSGKWVKSETKLNVYVTSTDTEVDTSKTYYTFSSSNYTYSVVTSPSGDPSSKGYYERSQIDFSSRSFDPKKTIAEIFESRENIIYSTISVCPYNISFLCGENGLIITAKSK